MADDTAALDASSQPDSPTKGKGAGKARLKSLDDLDRRTSSARHALSMRNSLVAERGGEENMSVLRLAAADQVAVLGAVVSDLSVRWLQGEDVDLSALVSTTNAWRRAAETLGDAPKPQAKIVIDHDDVAQRRQMARALVQVLEGADADSDDLPSTWDDDDPDAAAEMVRRAERAAAKEVRQPTAPASEPTSQSEILDALRSLDPSSWHYKPAATSQVGEVELVGDVGYFIELLAIGNDGRQKWAVCDAAGERVTAVWGKAEALAACNELITKGAITRKGANA